MVKSIANDITVDCVYAESRALANFLVSEAIKQEDAAYVSAEGHIMQEIARKKKCSGSP